MTTMQIGGGGFVSPLRGHCTYWTCLGEHHRVVYGVLLSIIFVITFFHFPELLK